MTPTLTCPSCGATTIFPSGNAPYRCSLCNLPFNPPMDNTTPPTEAPAPPPALTDKDFFIQFDSELRNTLIDAMERFRNVPVNHDRSGCYTKLREAFFYISADISNLTAPQPEPTPENPTAPVASDSAQQ